MSDLSAVENANCNEALHPKALEGLELFNASHYFEAHEALEAAWRDKKTGPERDLYRAILQVGVVYLHITRRNYAGAIKVYQRSLKWLALWPETCRGVPVGQVRRDLEVAIGRLKELGPGQISEFDLSLLKPIQFKVSSL